LCEDVFDHYERFGDAERAVTAFPLHVERGGGHRTSPRLESRLWHNFTLACSSGGGGGIPQIELRRLYHYKYELEEGTGATTKPFTEALKTQNSFIAAVRRFTRSLIFPYNWMKIVMDVDGRQYPASHRDAFDTAQEEFSAVDHGDLRWGEDVQKGMEDDASASTRQERSTLLKGVWDGTMCKNQRKHVRRSMQEGTLLLGVHLYSDAMVQQERCRLCVPIAHAYYQHQHQEGALGDRRVYSTSRGEFPRDPKGY